MRRNPLLLTLSAIAIMVLACSHSLLTSPDGALAGKPAFAAEPTAAPSKRITPGASVGPVRLGMTTAEVQAAMRPLAKPEKRETVKRTPKGKRYQEEDYLTVSVPGEGQAGLNVLYEQGRVVQIAVFDPAFKTASGLSSATLFPGIRKTYPRLKVSMYAMVEGPDTGGYVGYFLDEKAQGIAFVMGTQDDRGTYETLSESAPGSVIVHRRGRSVIPVESALYGQPSQRYPGDYFDKIAKWFAGQESSK